MTAARPRSTYATATPAPAHGPSPEETRTMFPNALRIGGRIAALALFFGLLALARPGAAEAQDAPGAADEAVAETSPAPSADEPEADGPGAEAPGPNGAMGVDALLVPDVPISTEDGWQAFDWADEAFPTTAEPTFQFEGCAVIDITDAYEAGDVFEIYDDGELLGETSEPSGGNPDTDDPDEAFDDPAYSSGSFLVGEGGHDISIVVIEGYEGFFGPIGRGFLRLRPCPTDLAVEMTALKDGGAAELEAVDEAQAEDAAAAQPPNTVFAGEELVYRVKVTNLGKVTAERVRVRITLPPQLIYLENSYDPDACQQVNDDPFRLRCRLGDIDPLGMVAFEIKTRVRADAVANEFDGTIAIRAEAEVSALNDDPNLANNVDDVTCFVQDSADLMIMKIAESPTVNAGEPFVYRILVDNLGPSFARGVRIQDDIISSLGVDIRDAEFLDDPFRNDECSVNEAQDTVDCILYGALEPVGSGFSPQNGRWEIRIIGRSTEDQTLTNKASVYTGPLLLGPIIINGGQPPVQTAPLVLAPDVLALQQGDQGTPDPNPDNNVAQSVIQVRDTIDLDMDLDDDTDPVIAGTTFEYEVNVEVEPPGPAPTARDGENVGVRMVLPRGLKVQDIDGLDGDPECEIQESFNDTILTCYVGTVEPGEDNGETFFVEVFVDPSYLTNAYAAGTNGVLTTSACAFSTTQIELDVRDTCELETTDVESQAALLLDKTPSLLQTEVTAGGEVEYAITVSNDGPSTIDNLVVRDNFDPLDFSLGVPVELLEANVDGGPGACYFETVFLDQLATAQVRCDLGDLPPNTGDSPQRIIHLRFRVKPDAATYGTPGGPLVNCLTSSSDTEGMFQVPETLGTCVALDIVYDSELELSKRALSPTAVAGGTLTYELKVTNDGPSTAFDVGIRDLLPAGVELLWVSDDRCVLANGNTELRCPVGDLAPGAMATIRFTVRLAPDLACGAPLVNRARAVWDRNGSEDDGREASTEDRTATVTVDCESDLRVRKYGKPDGEVRAGERLTYTIVVDNLGPSFAPRVVLKDLLSSSGQYRLPPGGLTSDRPMRCESDAPGGGTAGIFDGSLQIDCLLLQPLSPLGAPGFPNPGRWTIQMIVETLEPQDVNNTATVLSDATDPDESNNEAHVQHEFTAVADLGIRKEELGPEPFVAGTERGYSLEIRNDGPSTAEGVVVYDVVPAGMSVVDVEAGQDQSSCELRESFGNTIITCQLGTMAPGDLRGVGIEVVIDEDIPDETVLINSACVLSDNFDDDTSDNCAEETTRIGSVATLTIEKAGSPTTVVPGERMTWVVQVGNEGPSTAKQVLIQDNLPPDVLFESARLLDGDGNLVAGADCALVLGDPNDAVSCDAGDLAVGDALRLVITVRVDPAVPAGAMLNVARALASNALQVAADAEVEKTPEADLSIDKDVLDPTPVAGTNTQFLLRVRNDGPSVARNVVVDDFLPPGFVAINDNDACAVVPGPGIIGCSLGDMAPGQEIELLLTVAVDPSLPGSAELGARYFNAGVVSSDTFDPDEGNNQDRAGAWVETVADLRVRKFGKMDGQVRAGENLTYTIIVDNLGPSFAHDMELRDEIVSSGFFDILSIDPDVTDAFQGAACDVIRLDALPDGPAPQLANDQRATVVCTTGEDVPVFDGDGGEGRWVVEIVVTAAQTTDINNVASVTSDDTRDPNQDNNEAYVEHEITDVADLSVTKACTPAVAGDPANFSTCTMVVSNAGPSDAENVILSDHLPPFTTLLDVRVAPDGAGQCAADQPTTGEERLMCGLGTDDGEGDRLIRPGEEVTVEVDLLVDSGYLGLLPETETLQNDVFVTSDIFDPDLSDNRALDFIDVSSEAVLRLRKADQPDPVVAGDPLTYRLTLTNDGPSVASQVELIDILPTEVDFLSATVLDGTGNLVGDADCERQLGNNRVYCRLGDMLVDATYRIFLQVRVDSATLPGAILNRAEVSADNSEGDEAEEETTVVALADLSVVKTIDDPSPVAGTQTTYRVTVRNDGPSDAVNVQLVDFLPDGFTLINQDDACTPVPATNQVTCRPVGFGPDWRMEPGDEVTFQLNVAIDPALTPSAISGLLSVNEAQVSSDTQDQDLRNNTDSADAWIDSEADLRVRKFGKMDGQVRAGEFLTYTIITDNLGPSFGHSVTITDEIVSSGVFDIVSIDPDVNGEHEAAACEITRLDTDESGLAPAVEGISQRARVTCEMGEDLPVFDPGAGTGRWVVEVIVTAPQTTDVNNVASVSSRDLDPDFSNNEAYVEHEITDVADLSISKSAIGEVVMPGCPPIIEGVPDEATAGLRVTYTIEVQNAGPSDAENVLIYDRLPPGIVVESAEVTVGEGQCATGMPGSAADRLVCGVHREEDPTRDVLQPGQNAVITVVARLDPALVAGGSLENDAYVTSDIFDPSESNNQTYQLTDVSRAADLEIVKTSDPDPVSAGEDLQFILTVTNFGPSVADEVVVEDLLPAEVDYVSATGAACLQDAIQTREITCELGDMAPGEVREIKLLTTVKPDAVPPGLDDVTITNEAAVSSLTFDPCLENNEATDDTLVLREADVFARKSDSPDPVNAGTELRYRITFGNDGPSTATDVTVRDLLPLGLTYDRCEPIDPNDEVTCTVLGGDGDVSRQEIGLVSIEMANTIVWGDPTLDGGLPAEASDLDPNETYSFYLVADVDSGYVLDDRGDTGPGEACEAYAQATNYEPYAHNRVTILARSDGDIEADVGRNNFDDECTRVEGLADLEIDLTDIFDLPEVFLAQQAPSLDAAGADAGDAAAAEGIETTVMPLQAPNNDFLRCDPVEPGGMITYVVRVTNNGPSDAAEVVVELQLDGEFVAVDPAQIDVEFVDAAGNPLDGGIVEEIRDDGRITVVLGRDNNQLGRIDVGNSYYFRVMVMVRLDAPCGKEAPAVAKVFTREAQAGNVPGPTPTRDPDLSNNIDRERTRIECPKIEVDKTVSYDGTCPGSDVRIVPPTAGKITFCYTIRNTGTTYLDYVRITDTLRTRGNPMPTIIFTDVIRSAGDPKIPVPPGAVLTVKAEIDSIYKECGVATNEVMVTADPVNSGRTRYPCIEPVSASDTLNLEVPCAGVDWRLQLPILNNAEGSCEPWIQVQNVGDQPTKALLLFWGEAGFCPPQAAGPLKAECSGLLRPGSAWSFSGAAGQIPQGSYSAVAYSMSVEPIEISPGTTRPFADELCNEVFFSVVGDYNEYDRFNAAYLQRGTWEGFDFGKYPGEPLALSVNRGCPDVADANLLDHAAYTGISSDMGGAYDPKYGGYTFYAPLVLSAKGDLNSTLHIQNAGDECTSLEIWFKAQDNCLRPMLGDVLALAPGETVSYDPSGAVGPDWLGAAWIRGTQPLGIVVDTMGPNHFTSYTGLPADVYELDYTYGNQVNYAPLIYSEYQGWDTALQVQNLSAVTAAKVKVYFLDRSGDIITTLVDWICPRGSQSFYLPVIENIPGNWVGSARAESQEWWSPGSPLVDPPKISTVVLLEKWADAARTARREAVAYNGQTECLLFDWQIAPGTKGGTSSGSAVFAIPLIAKGYEGITSEIGITNLVPKPGFTDFAIYLYDQNGLLDFFCQKLNEKQVEYIDLNTWGIVPQRFLGSMVVSAVFWEHDVFDGSGQFERNLVGLGSVAVERIGGTQGGPDVPGDESKAFEALPIFDHFMVEDPPNCPGVGTP